MSDDSESVEYEGIPKDTIGRTVWNLEGIAGMTLLSSPVWLPVFAALCGAGYGVYKAGSFAVNSAIHLYNSSPSLDSLVQKLQELYNKLI